MENSTTEPDASITDSSNSTQSQNNASTNIAPTSDATLSQPPGQTTEQPKSKERCYMEGCHKKVILFGFNCKCTGDPNYKFCMKHRMPEEHDCTVDYKEEGRKQLEKALPKVTADKVNQI